MRITTGQYKGRKVAIPEEVRIRPTQPKVRKALFDILGDIEGLTFLELFAGSGAVGFEAISRGAKDLALVESNRDCQLTIRKNIDLLRVRDCCIYPFEAEKAILSLHRDKRTFDIIFLDPPYSTKETGDSLSKKTLHMLGAYDILPPNGLAVVQHFKRDELPSESGQLELIKESKYGSTLLSFYRKKD